MEILQAAHKNKQIKQPPKKEHNRNKSFLLFLALSEIIFSAQLCETEEVES